MRKSAGTKTGLNIRKPVVPTQATNSADSRSSAISTKSVFSEHSDTEDIDNKAAPETKIAGFQVRSSKVLSVDRAEADPSVYAYDEVYDEISNARNRIKNQRLKKDDLKPKYMEKLIESAKQRQIQKEVVRERLLTKERQREGEKFADKEVIVTDGYKKQKEMRQKLVEEEELREQKQKQQQQQQQKEMGTAGFYRGILDHIDREDVSKAIAESNASSRLVKGDREQHIAAEHENKQSLRAGLNVSSHNKQQQQKQHQERLDSRQDSLASKGSDDLRDDHRPASAQHHHLREKGLSLSRDVAEQKRLQEEAKEQERQELIRKYARRNDRAAIEAARMRYLQRKQAVSFN
ncbi:hypothetical protein J3B02_000005 [Coemansia erecta]|uniref:Nuclear speckle splicing regulatory protein 1 N-terminal domain-containing protein n=1 Tax=Coemansia asiatica TaxID=1052880 RepID=A0A9W7XM62_9FUNG|nr:hypothetical protein LPJ64_002873 [Coemansia asiatica]KAJ2858626.1 hypothetical protein J3B02_000005 [Coemansia erecta]